MLPDDQAAQQNGQRQQHHVMVHKPSGKGEGCPGPDGAQGDPFGERGQDQESPPHHQRHPPINHDSDGASGEDPLAPLKVEHTGEHVPQKAESSRPVLTKRHYQKLIRHQILCRQDANPYSHDCFEHIGQDNHKGQRPAEGAVEVGQPGIAAAMGTHIVPQDILGDDDRPVEAAAEVGDHCDQQGRKQQGRPQLTQCGGKVRLYSRGNCCRICHDYPSLSLFCRMVSRTGVPSRPKVERIWFSR